MASKDPYTKEYAELSGGDVGTQYLTRLRQQTGVTDWMQKAAESLAGVPEAGKKAYAASKKDVLANLASEQYRRRRTPIGAALTAAEQKRRTAQRGFGAQEADMAKMALQEKSVSDLAFAKVEETKIAQGMDAEKGLETLASVAPVVEGWKNTYDSMWGADEEEFFKTAITFASESLPPHLRSQFMEMYVMPTYKDWGGDRVNPFLAGGTTTGPVASGGSSYESIPAPPIGG